MYQAFSGKWSDSGCQKSHSEEFSTKPDFYQSLCERDMIPKKMLTGKFLFSFSVTEVNHYLKI